MAIKYLQTPDMERTALGDLVNGSTANAVLYTEQNLTDAQKKQARENIGAGSYSRPNGGIPASDLAPDVIPTVPAMASAIDMADWTSGKTVDAAVLAADFGSAMKQMRQLAASLDYKADSTDIPSAVSQLANDSGFQTKAQVLAAIAGAREDTLEPIRTYTCDGTEGTSFYLNTDDNGDAFRLKKAVVRVTLGAVSAAGTFSANLMSGASKILAQCYTSYAAAASSYKYICVAEQDGGFWAERQSGTFANTTAALQQHLSYSYFDTAAAYPHIDRLRLTRAVPAGTVIELLGVRYTE